MNEFALRRQWGPKPNYPKVVAYIPPKNDFVVISGPCSVESESQIKDVASFVKIHGATHLRGGVFRAGTYPGHVFGLVDEKLLEAYYQAAKANRLSNIIEILDYTDEALDLCNKYADCFQVGCRQMQNYTLLRKLGKYGKPVFLKRHPGSTIDEWLGAAEHVLTGGVKELYLIERGSSTHLNHVRWDLSISMIPAVQKITNIPVIVDGSHGTGRRDLVAPMTLAGIAAGADGILVETHPDPTQSWSDSDQAIGYVDYKNLMKKVFQVKNVLSEE